MTTKTSTINHLSQNVFSERFLPESHGAVYLTTCYPAICTTVNLKEIWKGNKINSVLLLHPPPFDILTPSVRQKVTNPDECIWGWKKRTHLLWMEIWQGANANSTSGIIYRTSTWPINAYKRALKSKVWATKLVWRFLDVFLFPIWELNPRGC